MRIERIDGVTVAKLPRGQSRQGPRRARAEEGKG
jgi:hypothetical protein